MRKAFLLFLLAGCLNLGACGDDPAGPPRGFSLSVRVVDPAGQPVPDLELLMLMDSDFYQDGRAAAKAAVRIPVVLAIPATITVTVEDVTGATVRTLFEGVRPAGPAMLVWDGRDDAGVHQASGLYRARLVARDDADQVLYDGTQPMFMALLDFDRATAGVTNGEGSIVVHDQRLFPHLYGEVPMQALDENGDVVGPFPLTSRTRFYLRDLRYGHIERFDLEVQRSGQVVVLNWQGVDDGGKRASPPVVPVACAPAIDPPEAPFELRQPFPNPFN